MRDDWEQAPFHSPRSPAWAATERVRTRREHRAGSWGKLQFPAVAGIFLARGHPRRMKPLSELQLWTRLHLLHLVIPHHYLYVYASALFTFFLTFIFFFSSNAFCDVVQSQIEFCRYQGEETNQKFLEIFARENKIFELQFTLRLSQDFTIMGSIYSAARRGR